MGNGKKKIIKKSVAKRRTGEDVYIGKYEHIFNKRWSENEIKCLADELLVWMETETKNLWFNDFFVTKRISRNRISEFCEKNKYFKRIHGICNSIQESRMFEKGTSRSVNPAMFIMGLKNNHNWTDKRDVNLSGGVKIIKDSI